MQELPEPQSREVALTPYAEREIRKAKDDYARAVASGQLDEIQVEELWNKTDAHVKRLMRSSAEEQTHPARDALEQQFDEQVLEIDGKLVQQDPESGRFEVLSEPVKDAREMEEMEFQRTIDTQKGRIDLMKQLASLSTGTAESGQKPMYTPEQIKQEVDRMLPEVQPGGQGQGPPTPEQFDQEWANLPSGGEMMGPDGNTYRKQ